MAPEEICRRLGETRVKGIFAGLTSDAMKKILKEGKISTQRLASHTSTKKRNEDWGHRVWQRVADPTKAATTLAATLLFEWLTRERRPLLAAFLTAIDVKHEGGLTDADFMQTTPPEKLVEAGKALFSAPDADKVEVAAYLLFLDASNKSEVFAPLELEQHLPAAPAAAAG